MSDEIRANYDQLENVASRLASQSQQIQTMLQKVKGSMSKLENGGWIGQGADAFFNEMTNVVLPATTRLQNVLQEASATTKNISQTMKQAEEEAAAPFKQEAF